MSNPVARAMLNFVPEEYYNTVMEFYGVDTQKYPHTLMEFDHVQKRQAVFSVFEFYVPKIADQPVAAMIIVYKCLSSKVMFRRLVYLDNMSPACQAPPPYRYGNLER